MNKDSSEKVRTAMAHYLAEHIDQLSIKNREQIFEDLKKSPLSLLARMIIGLSTPGSKVSLNTKSDSKSAGQKRGAKKSR